MSTIIKAHDNICVIIDKELSKDFLQKYWFPHAVKLLKTHDAELRKNGYGPIMPANLNNIPVRIKSDVVVVVAILFSEVQCIVLFVARLILKLSIHV